MHMSHTPEGRFLVAATLCAALALPPGVVVQAAGKPSPTPPPLPVNDYSMGRAPQNCPATDGSMVHAAYNNKPNVFPHRFWWIGRGPLVGHSDWIVHGHRVTLHFGSHTKYGYPQKVGWQLMRGAHGPVTLQGWNLRTRQTIWFGHPLPTAHPQPVVPPPVIAWPAGIVRDHRAPNLLFVASAGCYMLRAQWKTGVWTLPFAAGCLADRRMFGVARCK